MVALLKVVKENYKEGKRTFINESTMRIEKRDVLFTDFINETVKRKIKRHKPGYEKGYNSVVKLINEFCQLKDAIIYTNSVNEEFLDEFIGFLEDKNYKLNYISSTIGLVKAMVKKASIYGYLVDPSYDDVTVKMDDPYFVYLTMNEITRIYYFEGLTRKQERVRDLFIIGCLTALRYSDYSTLVKENVNDNFITKITKKTGKKVIIPLHDYVKEILIKYDYNLPNFCNQYFNRKIKEVCKKIGIDEDVHITYTRGKEVIYETKKKWELISSHTARRSAATNMYLTGRMRINEIMQITGHTTEKNFFRYVKVTNEDMASKISVDNYFKK